MRLISIPRRKDKDGHWKQIKSKVTVYDCYPNSHGRWKPVFSSAAHRVWNYVKPRLYIHRLSSLQPKRLLNPSILLNYFRNVTSLHPMTFPRLRFRSLPSYKLRRSALIKRYCISISYCSRVLHAICAMQAESERL
jgi:hypothetical protein